MSLLRYIWAFIRRQFAKLPFKVGSGSVHVNPIESVKTVDEIDESEEYWGF